MRQVNFLCILGASIVLLLLLGIASSHEHHHQKNSGNKGGYLEKYGPVFLDRRSKEHFCKYISSYGDQYNFKSLKQHPDYKTKDQDGNEYFFNVCREVALAHCNGDDAVCIKTADNTFISGGKLDTLQIEDLDHSDGSFLPFGVRMFFTGGEYCQDGDLAAQRSTELLLECDIGGNSTEIVSIESDKCLARITVKSPHACPRNALLIIEEQQTCESYTTAEACLEDGQCVCGWCNATSSCMHADYIKACSADGFVCSHESKFFVIVLIGIGLVITLAFVGIVVAVHMACYKDQNSAIQGQQDSYDQGSDSEEESDGEGAPERLTPANRDEEEQMLTLALENSLQDMESNPANPGAPLPVVMPAYYPQEVPMYPMIHTGAPAAEPAFYPVVYTFPPQ